MTRRKLSINIVKNSRQKYGKLFGKTLTYTNLCVQFSIVETLYRFIPRLNFQRTYNPKNHQFFVIKSTKSLKCWQAGSI